MNCQKNRITAYFEDENPDRRVSNLKQKEIVILSEPENKHCLCHKAHLNDLDEKLYNNLFC